MIVCFVLGFIITVHNTRIQDYCADFFKKHPTKTRLP